MLVWYDSVIHSGQLKWQSALNDQNFEFFKVTDAFFTDYHWKLQNLSNTMETFLSKITNSNLSTYDIYIGNDTYGRGTYGGGQLDINKALCEIDKYPFSISLFG